MLMAMLVISQELGRQAVIDKHFFIFPDWLAEFLLDVANALI